MNQLQCNDCGRVIERDDLHGKPDDDQGYCVGFLTCLRQRPKPDPDGTPEQRERYREECIRAELRAMISNIGRAQNAIHPALDATGELVNGSLTELRGRIRSLAALIGVEY